MKKKPLTEKQREVLTFVEDYIADNGHSPSYAEIGDRFATSIDNARRYIKSLVSKGHITKDASARPPILEVVE